MAGLPVHNGLKQLRYTRLTLTTVPFYDDLLLHPSSELLMGSHQDMSSFLQQLESFHGVAGLFTPGARDFVFLEGPSTVHIDSTAAVYLHDPLVDGIISSGESNVWLVRESLGHLKVNGGSSKVFFESIPTEESIITILGGELELNFLPALGTQPAVELIGPLDGAKTVFVDGEATPLQVQLSSEALLSGASLSVMVLDELQLKLGNDVSQGADVREPAGRSNYLFDSDSDLIVNTDDLSTAPAALIYQPAGVVDLKYQEVIIETNGFVIDDLSSAYGQIEDQSLTQDWVAEYIGAVDVYALARFDEFDGLVI